MKSIAGSTKSLILSCIQFVVLTSLVGSAWALDLDQTVDFNIPKQKLDSALVQFSEQAKIQITSSSDQVKDFNTDGIVGHYKVSVALKTLLQRSGLSYKPIGQSAISIGKFASTASAVPGAVSSTTLMASQSSSDSSQNTTLAEAKSEPSPENGLGEIVVTGSYQFLDADTSGATNLPIPIEKVPQSISLVSSDFIKAADLKTLGEIAEYTPGAINVGNQLNTGSNILLRGFTPGRAVDGINVIQSQPFFEPEYAIYDRLEIVKGPSSVVYGVSSPGGVVNYVTKSATHQTPDYLYVQGGSWDSFRLEGQVAGAVDPSGRVRLIGIGVYDQGDSFLEEMHHSKASLYAGINVDLTDTISAYLHGGYERDRRLAFDGIPTEADGSPPPVSRSFFIGSRNLELTTNAYHAEGALTWHATDMLELSLKGNYENSNMTGGAGYASDLDSAGNIDINSYEFLEQRNENYGLGASSLYHLDELGLKDSFVTVGALFQSNWNPQQVLSANGGTTNIFDGVAAISRALDALLTTPLSPYYSSQRETTLTVSTQSLIHVTDPFSVLLGASWSDPKETVNSGGTIQTPDFSTQVSYRGALMYEVLPQTNAYFSYSQSFSEQPGLAVGGGALPPLSGDQYEVGVKYRTIGNGLLLTGALFQIKERNVAECCTTINGFDYHTSIGEVTHKGVELQGIGKITAAWQVNVGYAYLNPKITDDLDASTIGQTQLFLPKQTASLYSVYTVPVGVARGLSLGGGIRYISDLRTSYDNSTKDLPSYVLVDANASYTLDKWLVQLNVRNLFNKLYYINNYQTLEYGNYVGAPASVALSVRRQF